jgi:hypothetical protein
MQGQCARSKARVAYRNSESLVGRSHDPRYWEGLVGFRQVALGAAVQPLRRSPNRLLLDKWRIQVRRSGRESLSGRGGIDIGSALTLRWRYAWDAGDLLFTTCFGKPWNQRDSCENLAYVGPIACV